MGISAVGATNHLLTAGLTTGSGQNINGLRGPHGNQAAGWATASGVTTSGAGAWFVADAGSTATAWRCVSLHRTNLSPSASIRWRCGPNSSGASPTFDSGWVSGVDANYQQIVSVAPGNYTGRYLRVEIDDPGSSGQIRIPLAYAGPLLVPARSQTYGSSHGLVFGERVVTTRHGSEYVVPHWLSRTLNLQYDALTESEGDVLRDIDLDGRLGINTLIIPDITSPYLQKEAVFGRVQGADLTYSERGTEMRGWRGLVKERQ